MNIIAVAKDEQLLLEVSCALKNVFPKDNVEIFIDPMWAVKHTYNYLPELALVATEINRVDCFKLESTLKKTNPKIKVIFIVDTEIEAADMEAYDSLCICRPVTEKAVKDIIYQRKQ